MKKIINYQYEWGSKDVNVEDLMLDPKNIRLEIENGTQDEIINDLFMNEDAMQILENIRENGYFPDEPPVVVLENDKYFVLEGNRRVVALKAMISPEIAPTKYIEKIKKTMIGNEPIEKIEVRVAKSRKDADLYLAAKHTKTTRKPWTALRRAYFYYAQKEKGQTTEKMMERYKGVDIPKYIKMYEMHHIALSLKFISDDTRRKVSNKRIFGITTLERFYNDKYVQDWMNIEFNNNTGEVRVPKTNSFDKVYSMVVTDIANKIATSRKQLENEKSRKGYIDSIIKEVLDGQKIQRKNISTSDKFKEKQIKILNKEEKLVSSKMENTLNSFAISRVLWELQNIKYQIFTNATADTLRTFLEIVLKKYLQEIKEFPKPSSKTGFIYLGDALNKMKKILNQNNKKGLVQVVKVLEGSKWYLDCINHNPDVFATDDKVKEAWEQMRPLIEYVFNDFKEKQKVKNKK